MCKGQSCPAQIFILLQYQTLAHRIKATVLRADNLDNLVHTGAAATELHLGCEQSTAFITHVTLKTYQL